MDTSKVNDDDNRKFKKIGCNTLIFLILLCVFFPDIKEFFQPKKNDVFLYGSGGLSFVPEEVYKEYKDKLNKLDQITDSIVDKYQYILIYTNDISIKNAEVIPDVESLFLRIKYDYTSLNQNNNDTYSIIKRIDSFLENIDTVGFGIWLRNEHREFELAKITNVNIDQLYKLTTFNYYTKKEKDSLRRLINNSDEGVFSIDSKEEQLKKIEEVQSSKVFLTDFELKEKKLMRKISQVFGPKKGSIDSSKTFYFTAYSNQVDIDQFIEKKDQLVSMFLRNQDTTGCYIRKIKLIKEEKSYK